MSKMNAFYAQSGGVTAVINASASGVIETARAHKDKIGKDNRPPDHMKPNISMQDKDHGQKSNLYTKETQRFRHLNLSVLFTPSFLNMLREVY